MKSQAEEPQDVGESKKILPAIAGTLHDRFVYRRRISAIAEVVSPLIPSGRLLDVGCGNGDLANYLMSPRSDLKVIGLEVYLRLRAEVRVVYYRGGTFPFADRSFASVIVADTLHHIEDKEVILKECLRVSRGPVIIKDHFYQNRWEYFLLRVLDIGGNAAHGVPSIFNYYSRQSWQDSLASIDAEELLRLEEVPGQYPYPFQWLIGKRIQFISKIVSRT